MVNASTCSRIVAFCCLCRVFHTVLSVFVFIYLIAVVITFFISVKIGMGLMLLIFYRASLKGVR